MQSNPIFEKLHALISWGEFRGGMQLKEEAIAKQFGVSRTPVRAALAALQDYGLIERTNGGSYAVKEFGEQDVLEALEIRAVIEGLAARLLAERGCSQIEFRELQRAIDKLKAAIAEVESGGEAFSCVRLSYDFYRLIAMRCRSFQVFDHFERITTLPFVGLHGLKFHCFPDLEPVFKGCLDDHFRLLDAIGVRDAELAETVARRHGKHLFQIVMRVYHSDARQTLPGGAMIKTF